MTEFLLKKNSVQLSDNVYQQISGTAIVTKFTHTYACIFMDQMESKLEQIQKL